MAWLSNEEWELQQDCREKKSVAASAHKQRTHCGKGGCKLPSDFMTKKEIKAMNGECVKYASLKGPMNWTEFKRLPDDLKKEYVDYMRDTFNVPNRCIAEMFNVHPVTLNKHFGMLGLAAETKRSGGTKWDRHAFDVWRGAVLDLPEIPVSDVKDDSVVSEVVENTPETPVEPAGGEIDIPVESVVVENAGVPEVVSETRVERKRAVPGAGKMTFDGPIEEIVETLQMLLAGAEVTLDVAWTVIDKE